MRFTKKEVTKCFMICAGMKFPHVLAAFYSLHPSAERNGHDQDNPSGICAKKYEDRYEENRRRTKK